MEAMCNLPFECGVLPVKNLAASSLRQLLIRVLVFREKVEEEDKCWSISNFLVIFLDAAYNFLYLLLDSFDGRKLKSS